MLTIRLFGALACPAVMLLTACASVPADHGVAAVGLLAADRGLAVPVPPAKGDERSRLTVDLLAHPLTQADAVRVAFLNNSRIDAEYARLGLSAADALQAGRLKNPTLSASWLFSSAAGAANRYDLGLTASLVDLLLLPARSRFSQGEFERARLDATQNLLALAADVQRAYYAAVEAQQAATLRNTIAAASDASAELASRFKEAGNFSALQLAIDQATASQARLDADQAAANATVAHDALNALMGLPAGATWQTATGLPGPVAKEDEPGDLQQLAATKRTDLLADRRAVDLLEDSLGITRSFRYVGEVETGVDYERDTDRNRLIGPSIALQLPIFNQGQAAVLRAQSQLDAARARLHTQELAIANEVQLASDQLLAARQRIDRLRDETIPLREAIVTRMQEQADAMLIGVFDLLRARQDEYASYDLYLQAIGDYWRARVALAKAVGSRLPSDAQIGAAVIVPELPIRPDDSHSMPGMSMPSPTGSATP